MSSTKISALPAKTTLILSDSLPIVDSSDTSNKKATLRNIRNGAMDQKLIFVSTKDDFPAAVLGVITLLADITYFITDTIDLAGDRLVCSSNTTIIGGSSENCGIKSTGLSASAALITSAWSLPIRNIFITHGTALSLDAAANPNQALDWFGVNFVDCNIVGTIANYNNFIMTDASLLNSSGLSFDGTIGTVAFVQCLFDNRTAGTAISILSSAVITRRIRITYSSFVAGVGETALNASVSASIPIEGYILDTINFSGGGTYITGVQSDDNKALFVNCRGISNSATIANYSMQNNAVATNIVTQGVAVKVAGTTTLDLGSKFSHTDNRATYQGALSQTVLITAVLSMTAGNNLQIGVYVAKNGSLITQSENYGTTSGSGRAENVPVQAIITMNTGDFIEIWVENASSNADVTVAYINVIARAI